MAVHPIVALLITSVVPLPALAEPGEAAPASGSAAIPESSAVMPAADAPVPEPSRSRLWASVPLSAVGWFAGTAGGIVGGYTVLGCSDEGNECDHAFDNAELATGAIFGGLGAAAGAHLGGYRGDSHGHFGYTLLAAQLPALAAAAATAIGGEDAAGVTIVLMLASPVAAIVTDHLVRVPRTERVSKVSLAAPERTARLVDVEVPVSRDLGIAAGYCRMLSDPLALCGRLGYRISESGWVDYPDNRHAVHASAGVRYAPASYVRMDVGALALTLDRDGGSGFPAGRGYHGGGHAALLFGDYGLFVGADVRIVGRFDDATQLTFVTRYEYPL